MDHKKYKKIAVGGTFDKFHDGHKKLLATAFELGEEVEIGVTSNAFGGLKGDIDSCEDRMRCLKEFFKDRLNYTVMVLDDAYGTTVFDDEFDAIVVSEETEPVAVEINEIRDSKGMSPLDIVVVSFVLADDGHPISSTRIRSGEINKKGNILKIVFYYRVKSTCLYMQFDNVLIDIKILFFHKIIFISNLRWLYGSKNRFRSLRSH